MQLFHFFVDEPNKSNEFLDLLRKLRIDFRVPSVNKMIGGVNLNMRDFKSPLVN